MKNLYTYIIVLFAAFSTGQTIKATVPTGYATIIGDSITPVDSVKLLVTQARWGDGNAYLKLADRCRSGNGMKKDFLCTLSMIEMAEQWGIINKGDEYIKSLPDSDDHKKFYLLCGRRDLDNDSIDKVFNTNSIPEVDVLRGDMIIHMGDTVAGMELIRQAANKGCTLASLYILKPYIKDKTVDDSTLLRLAQDLPIIYATLGDKYYEASDSATRNEPLAMKYYMMAEEHAMLNRRRAKLVLDYHKRSGNIQLSGDDIKRLEIIVGVQEK